MIVRLEEQEKNRFEIKNLAQAILSENDSNIDDDLENITGSKIKLELYDNKTGLSLGHESVVEV